LREAGLNSVETGDASWQCGSDGVLRAAEDDFRTNEIFEHVQSLTGDESVATFLRRFERDPRLRAQAQRARAFVEGFEAADPALASVRSIADELRSGVDATSSRPVGSYAPLFAHLAARCARAGVDLRMNAPVERIAWRRGDVTIGLRNAPELRARCAIVTLPVGVLRQLERAAPVTFAPPLPAEKCAALDGLEMGHAVRVTLAFRTPFWETIANGRYRDAAFFRCEGGAYNAFWTQLPLRDRTITAWAGGPRASALKGVPANERIERARNEFAAMFAQPELARREFEGGVTHDWSADPFACGAYSYVATGGGDARATLAIPLDETLFFAGEATAVGGQGGTVSGAFETGMRAAREVAQALNIGAAS
jgi:monoamine oxidase